MAHIRSGILKGLGGEGTASPVASLERLALIDVYPQHVPDDAFQTQAGHAGEAGGDAGIENAADMKARVTVEAADIVIRRVNDFLNGDICQKVPKRRNIGQGYRIYDIDFMTGGNLDETELLGVIMAAVGFRIQSQDA